MYLFFTDLDGTLLDAAYSYHAAQPALNELRTRGYPLVLVSSKTRAEVEVLRRQLHHTDPFITENGGAIFIPNGTFDFAVDGAIPEDDVFSIIELGTDYKTLRATLIAIRESLGIPIRGFGDMTTTEVQRLTGLSEPDAPLAMRREYDEPFVIEGSEKEEREVLDAVMARGLRWTRGGRFYHLTGQTDKGVACLRMLSCYRRLYGDAIITVALGDSDNDLPMLATVDRPILVRRPDGSHAGYGDLRGVITADGIGPLGWNEAVLALLRR